MKKIYILIVLLSLTTAGLAQPGTTCNLAILESANPTCNFTTYVTTGSEMWFSFVATTPGVSISILTQTFSTNIEHIHTLTLLSATCASLQEIGKDELVFIDDAEELIIDATGLTVGNTYYIRADRTGEIICERGICQLPGNAQFDLCIEAIDGVIPPNLIPVFELPTLPNAYYRNKGQVVDTDGNPRTDIRAYTVNTSPKQYFFDERLSYVFAAIDTIPATIDSLHRVDMQLIGELPAMKKMQRIDQVPGHLNYYLGHVPTGIRQVPGFSRLVYPEVYPNIDLHVSSNKMGIQYFFVVKPGGDENLIKMRFSGQDNLSIDGQGGLNISTPIGSLRFEVPHAYKVPPNGNPSLLPQPDYINTANGTVEFDIAGNIPPNFTLVIIMDEGHETAASPAIDNLNWCTYYGGPVDETDYIYGIDITTDRDGKMYTTGGTKSDDFPVTVGAFQTLNAGGFDAYISAFKPGGIPIWSTYYGGDTLADSITVNGLDQGSGITVDNLGNLYVTGITNCIDFPTFPSGTAYYDTIVNDGLASISFFSAFILKLDTATGIPSWATFFGTNDKYNSCRSIATDFFNNVYIAGENQPSAYHTTFPYLDQGGGAYFQDTLGSSFIAKFNANNELVWSTLFGTIGSDYITDVCTDLPGNLFITGRTQNSAGAYPVENLTGGYQQAAGGGSHDAIVAKFSPTGQLLWSTFFGAGGTEKADGIACGPNDNIYITGRTNSASGFPVFYPGGNAYIDSTKWGAEDIFIAKFDNNGVQEWTTLYGGSGTDQGHGIAVDIGGNIFVSGRTQSTNFELHAAINVFQQNQIDNTTGGNKIDAFILSFSPSLERQWATYFGGNSSGSIAENGRKIAVSPQNRLYMTGRTWSNTVDIPVVDPGGGAYFQATKAGQQESYLAEFLIIPFIPDTTPPLSINSNDMHGSWFVYPNPGNDELTVQLNKMITEPVKLQIIDLAGKVVISEPLIPGINKLSLDINHLANGMYFISIGNKPSETLKFIKSD